MVEVTAAAAAAAANVVAAAIRTDIFKEHNDVV